MRCDPTSKLKDREFISFSVSLSLTRSLSVARRLANNNIVADANWMVIWYHHSCQHDDDGWKFWVTPHKKQQISNVSASAHIHTHTTICLHLKQCDVKNRNRSPEISWAISDSQCAVIYFEKEREKINRNERFLQIHLLIIHNSKRFPRIISYSLFFASRS